MGMGKSKGEKVERGTIRKGEEGRGKERKREEGRGEELTGKERKATQSKSKGKVERRKAERKGDLGVKGARPEKGRKRGTNIVSSSMDGSVVKNISFHSIPFHSIAFHVFARRERHGLVFLSPKIK